MTKLSENEILQADFSVRRAINPLGLNARKVVAKRYSLKDAKGNSIEEWSDIVARVVAHVSVAETDPAQRDLFYNAMSDIMNAREFVPNTPCLVNAGKPNGQLAACFVLDVPDSIAGIMKTATDAAIIHQTGGGTGFTFEKLRPNGSMVSTTHGVASGPVSFMNIFNTTTDTVKQGGVRRGANMGMMRVTHPDVLRFIHAKNDQHSLTNFNISVNVTDKFLEGSIRASGINSNSKPKVGTNRSSIQSRAATMSSIAGLMARPSRSAIKKPSKLPICLTP